MIDYGFGVDIGKVREKNEDAANIVKNNYGDIFMIVLDGMGGHNQGDFASLQAMNFICKSFESKENFSNNFSAKFWMKNVLKKANKYLNDYAKIDSSSKGMGTTLASFLLHDNRTIMSYIGDTRAYIIKENIIKQVSEDETYVQFLYEAGKIKKEEMATHPSRHVVTNALGCYKSVIINVKEIKEDYDYLLLCSDGLYNMVNEEDISNIIRNGTSVKSSIDELISLANKNGGVDNIAICIYKKGDR